MAETEIEMMIEIPGVRRTKYRFDETRNVIRVDRLLFTASSCPDDYGLVPGRLAEDGNPLDALGLVDEQPRFRRYQPTDVEVRS